MEKEAQDLIRYTEKKTKETKDSGNIPMNKLKNIGRSLFTDLFSEYVSSVVNDKKINLVIISKINSYEDIIIEFNAEKDNEFVSFTNTETNKKTTYPSRYSSCFFSMFNNALLYTIEKNKNIKIENIANTEIYDIVNNRIKNKLKKL